MRYLILAASLLLGPVSASHAEINVYFGAPPVEIGVNLDGYPNLVPVPGYPVYYDPYGNSNYFFYDGLYWVYEGDNWYASSWYNGPWQPVYRDDVPVFILRVPVRYYRQPPEYFRAWGDDEPPRWGEHWGHRWEEHHHHWDHWDRHDAPPLAPLPAYQREYYGDRYPHAPDQQRDIVMSRYHYQPRDVAIRQHWQDHGGRAEGGRGDQQGQPWHEQRVQNAQMPYAQPLPQGRQDQPWHQDQGHQDQGHQDQGHQDQGHQDQGHQDQGRQGQGHQDQGHQDHQPDAPRGNYGLPPRQWQPQGQQAPSQDHGHAQQNQSGGHEDHRHHDDRH